MPGGLLVAAFFFFWWGWYRGQGPLLPQVPGFSVGAGRGRDGGWFGRWWLVAEVDAGAWERSARANDQHEQTISMVGATHPLGRVWGGGGSGVGSSRGGVLGKQERPGSEGCRAGWDVRVRRGDQTWVLRRRATASRPARPVPKSSMVAGSGTAFMSST